jgi:hypothetical protein
MDELNPRPSHAPRPITPLNVRYAENRLRADFAIVGYLAHSSQLLS